MVTDYTKEELQHVVRVHAALKDDYKKLHTAWVLSKNPIRKEALGKRLQVKAQRLAQLSEEIRLLATHDSIMEEDSKEDAVVED